MWRFLESNGNIGWAPGMLWKDEIKLQKIGRHCSPLPIWGVLTVHLETPASNGLPACEKQATGTGRLVGDDGKHNRANT